MRYYVIGGVFIQALSYEMAMRLIRCRRSVGLRGSKEFDRGPRRAVRVIPPKTGWERA